MKRYGGSGSGPLSSDPSREAETGLEEATRRLGLGGSKSYSLAEAERTDGAKYRFNHSPERSSVMGAGRADSVEYPERLGRPLCQYYMRTGTCKFGTSCKFNHPKHGDDSVAPVSLNYYGYPLRPGEKECSYYMRNGQCKFGPTCKFHHPQPPAIPFSTSLPTQHPTAVSAPFLGPALYPVQSPSVYPSQPYGFVVARPSLMPPYVQGPYGPMLFSPGMIQYPGWNPYQASVSPGASPTAQSAALASSPYGTSQYSPSASMFSGPHQSPLSSVAASSGSQKEHLYPQRPGQAECQHYMKTGDCKYGSSCKYHHPEDLTVRQTVTILSPLGLPLRPGVPICTHFQQRGICKFGQSCKFDHPMREFSYSPSASSLSDMPVAPYPVGSSLGTLALSSSSSELRPERISGSTRVDSTSPQATDIASVGTLLSREESGYNQQKPDRNPPVSRTTEDQRSS